MVYLPWESRLRERKVETSTQWPLETWIGSLPLIVWAAEKLREVTAGGRRTCSSGQGSCWLTPERTSATWLSLSPELQPCMSNCTVSSSIRISALKSCTQRVQKVYWSPVTLPFWETTHLPTQWIKLKIKKLVLFLSAHLPLPTQTSRHLWWIPTPASGLFISCYSWPPTVHSRPTSANSVLFFFSSSVQPLM